MLAKLTAAFIAIILTTVACGQEAQAPPDLYCWRASYETKQAKNKNEFTLCRSHDYATQEIYFPNYPVYEPTNCSSVGTAVDSDPLTSIYRFSGGTCDNGRELNPAEFVCTAAGNGLSCLHKGVRLEFSAVEKRP